jgi:DNA mismatch endonuclease (patch repair protein)
LAMAGMARPPRAVSARMAAVRNKNTDIELALRGELHRRGLRYRANFLIPDLGRIRPDVVFTRRRIAVFVDGCFWHSCPEHGTRPKTNRDWWAQKLGNNSSRDKANDAALDAQGWTVIRVWQHEPPVDAADRIEELVRAWVG